MRSRTSENGAISAMMAIMLPVVVAATGIVFDLGRAYSFKREMQSAADAAALAAVHEWRQENFSSYDDAAIEDAAYNGFVEGEGADIEVNVPPTSGVKEGDSSFVEVVIRQPAPMYFMRMFRSEAPVVAARAVAGLMPQDACLYVMHPSASGALTVSGSSSVTFHDCGVQVNSSSSTAAMSQGSATLTATSVAAVGGYTGTGFFPTPVSGITPSSDPLAYLEAPASSSCTYTEKQTIKTPTVLSPGVYCGGLEVTADGDVTLQPGTYVIKGGGLKTQAGAVLHGEGVTIYNTGSSLYPWEPFDFHASSSTVLSAPTTGDYKGILFFTDRDVDSTELNIFAGTPDTRFTGVLYFPNTDVRFTGNSSMEAHKMVFAVRKVEFQGNTTIEAYNMTRDLLPSGLAVARVVE